MRRRLERLLEALADLTVGVGDQLVQLSQRGVEILALALELLDVGQRLLVFGLGERVDRSELLAAAGQPLQATMERCTLLLAELGVRRPGVELEAAGQLLELTTTLLKPVPDPFEPDLALGQMLGGLVQLRV